MDIRDFRCASERPLHELESGSFFLSRYEDVVALYRDAHASSDKKLGWSKLPLRAEV